MAETSIIVELREYEEDDTSSEEDNDGEDNDSSASSFKAELATDNNLQNLNSANLHFSILEMQDSLKLQHSRNEAPLLLDHAATSSEEVPSHNGPKLVSPKSKLRP